MSIYDIDYNIFGVNAMPPDKRKPKLMAMVQSLLYGLVTKVAIFRDYRLGSIYNAWDSTITYSINDKVQYKKAVYQSLVNSNVANTPTNTAKWVRIVDNYIGCDERIKYSCNKIVFEYALNRWFGGVFRQPGSATPSDIYIQFGTFYNNSFDVTNYEGNSDKVFANYATGSIYNAYILTPAYQFTIMIKLPLYNAIAGGEKEIRAFADRINAAGINYNIQTY